MIFKTITDETTLSGQRIIGALQARKIAQQQATAQLEIDIACLKEYQVACQNGTVTTEQFDVIMHKASASAVEYSAKVKAGTGTAQSYANAQRATNSALQEVSIGAGIASKAVKLFSTALNMIAFTAIIQGISWLIGKVDEWIVTAKEAKESADAFKQSLSTFFNETQTNLKTISSLSDRFNELSKNVDDNGKKVSGTEEEYAEFLDICQQVGQIMPELITGYTNEGEAIIALQRKVDSLTDSYKEAIKAKASLFISNGDEEGNTIDNFFEDYDNFINGYKGLWDLKTSPSGQNSLEDFEEYYGYDKIHEWLSKVKDASLNELNNLEGELATAQRGYMYIAKILDDSDFDITNITEENYNAIHDVLNNRFTVMEKELSDRVINIRSAFQNMLYADSDYWNIDDENVLSAINSLYGSIDAEFIKNNELFSQKALQTFESDFVSLFNNDATKQAMVNFYTPIADDETVKDYANRIKSSLETVQSYCNENGITVPINFDDSEQTINDLEAQYQRAVDFAKDKFDGYDPTAFFKEHSINTQEKIDAWQEIAQGARDAAEAEKEYLNQGREQNSTPTLSDLLNTEDLSDTKKELLELAKSGELTPDTFTSTKEYMSLLEQTGLTAKQACDEIKKLPEFDMDLSDWQTQLQNARSNVSELKGMLDELTSKDSKGLSTSSVDKIISDYPKLLGYLNDTLRLIEEINNLISDQSDIANNAGSMIIDYSSDAYIQMRDIAQSSLDDITVMQNGQIQSVAEMYGIDLNNYSNLAQAKKSIEFALLGSLNEGWAEHFGVVIDSLSGMAKVTQDLGGFYADPEAQSKLAAYNELITKLNSAKSRFESNVNYGSAGVGNSSKSSSSKSEKDLWLEEYKKKLAELQNLLAKGRLMPSPVVIQDV